MKTLTSKHSKLFIALCGALTATTAWTSHAESFSEALTSGKASIDMRLRYEDVEQDNALQDASAFTFRTRLGYTTGSYNGFSFTVEMEDNRIAFGEGDYSVPPAGYNPGVYSVIADPEFTELDQGFIQYKNDSFTAKLGRQVIALDNHRFVGHVGFRQDRQTFDAATLIYAPNDAFALQYNYIDQRNRIFGEEADLDAKDHLINASYKTSLGKLSAYGYLLEVDNDTDNSLDTFGVRFAGGTKYDETKLTYAVEYASQSSESAAGDFDADYWLLEGAVVFSPLATLKVGYEVLGSDDGAYGFSTPLATLHKFNGWADVFLNTPKQGLKDLYVGVSGKMAGGGWMVIYHDFEADESTAAGDSLGSEWDLQYTYKFHKHLTGGVKYAAYSGDGGKVDTDKLWLWLSSKF